MLQQRGYGKECDWWSVGVILFECLVGYPPFRSSTTLATHEKILKHARVLPALIASSCAHLSREACDLIARLLAPAPVRLGARGGMAEILSHVWFRGFDWRHIRDMVPPVVPHLASDIDVSRFDDVEQLQDPVDGIMCDTWKFAFVLLSLLFSLRWLKHTFSLFMCSRFVVFIFSLQKRQQNSSPHKRKMKASDIPFIGYTYRRFDSAIQMVTPPSYTQQQ